MLYLVVGKQARCIGLALKHELMTYFNYKKGVLHAEEVPLNTIAEQWGTPCYVYSRAALEHHWRVFDQALGNHPHKICYSVKANSNLALLNTLAKLGSGFDVVSGGELTRVLAAQGQASKTVFSGVGKSSDEIEYALRNSIACINVESIDELKRVAHVAASLNQVAPISIRINPDVDPKTHAYIATGMKDNKFGINKSDALSAYDYARTLKSIHIVGIDCHIGSQLLELSPFVEALDSLLEFLDVLRARGILIHHLNIGGGLGVRYKDEIPPTPLDYANTLIKRLQQSQHDRSLELWVEPGRTIVAHAGILLTRVHYLKQHEEKRFAIVDAAMNDFIRPALYQAWHHITPVVKPDTKQEEKVYDVVGPVCESSDFLGKDRLLAIKNNDLLALHDAGAYGFVMSSNYNTRPRAAEVLVDQDKIQLVRRRETVEELLSYEQFDHDDAS